MFGRYCSRAIQHHHHFSLRLRRDKTHHAGCSVVISTNSCQFSTMVSSKKTPECQSTEERADSRAVLSATRPRKSTKGKQRPTYRRRVKPPYSYAELITIAIKSSPSGMMTLREILDHMSASYECFRGAYIGWKNSVRHNLSANDCFVKVLRNSQRPYGKDNFWTLNTACANCLGTRDGSVGDASPDQSSCLPSSRSLHRSGSSSPASSCSDEASAPCLATVPAGYGQPGTVSRWPSPTPGLTPEMDARAVVGHASDEWSLLEDLFVPDADIDLALYGDVLGLTASNQPSTPAPSRHRFPGGAVQYPYPVSVVKAEYPSSYPANLPPADYSSHRPWHGYFPHGITDRQSAFLPYISSSADTNFARLRIKSEYTTLPSSKFVKVKAESTGPPHHESRGNVFTGRKEESTGPETNGHRLGSIVASAIRGCLSLDLEESALLAIERSVQLLDQTRPGDLACA